MLTRTYKQRLTNRTRLIKKPSHHLSLRLLVSFGVIAALVFTSIVSAKHFGDWGAPVNAESIPGTSPDLNTTANDGYAIMSPDGLSLYLV